MFNFFNLKTLCVLKKRESYIAIVVRGIVRHSARFGASMFSYSRSSTAGRLPLCDI